MSAAEQRARADRAPGDGEAESLLSVRGLSISFATDGGVVRAVEGVDFDVPRGKTVALVGESGCGKTATALALMRLLPEPVGRVDAGTVVFEGRDLSRLRDREMQAIRGARMAMVFQEPMTSLNPVYTVGSQIAEAVRLHEPVSRADARRRAIEALERVALPEPARSVDRYPHELSGGMRQRVMIAMALVCRPTLLIADEPTTALDMTTQAQILELLRELQAELGMAILLVAHDLALVAEVADEVVVLYAGHVMERGRTRDVLAAPRHPYTVALRGSIPPLAFRARGERRRLPTIEGQLPDLRDPPSGCRFHPRCPKVFDRCRTDLPPLFGGPVAGWTSRCFLADPSAPAPAAEESAAAAEEPAP